MKIEIPRLSTSNALTFSRNLKDCDYDDKYFFDVSKINNYEPLPMLLTAASIRQFCKERNLAPWDMQLVYSENKNYDYACHIGFFQAAGFPQGKAPGEAPGSSFYIPLTKFNIREFHQEAIKNGEYMEQGDLIERKSDELATVLAQGNRELQKMFRYLIREAIRNVPEHAGTNEVWICGQYWHNRDKAEIAILDEGIGVYESLKQNRIHREYVTNNEEALRWAIKPGISVSFKIKTLRQKLSDCRQCERDRETFTSAIRRFMRMDRLTAPLLRELIDHIDIFETEGTGKSRTQRIVIYYRFIGYIELPNTAKQTHIADTRKGVAVEYITEQFTA